MGVGNESSQHERLMQDIATHLPKPTRDAYSNHLGAQHTNNTQVSQITTSGNNKVGRRTQSDVEILPNFASPKNLNQHHYQKIGYSAHKATAKGNVLLGGVGR